MAAADDPATLRRLTAQLIGTDHKPHVEAAIQQARAAERYHRFRLISRKAPLAAGHSDPAHMCYGVFLCKGAVLMLSNEGEDGIIREDAPFTVRLVHVFRFCRPDISPEELRGERELRPAMLIDFHERQRPAEALLDLGPRLLGPLPDDLLPSLLPQPAVSGTRATALASHIFAAWLGAVPLPSLEPPAASAAAAPSGAGEGAAAAPAVAAQSSGWLGALMGLWNRVLGGKAITAEAQPQGEAKPKAVAEQAEQAELEQAEQAQPARASSPAEPPAMPLMEAWMQYEQRAQQKDPVVRGGSELEQAWFRDVLRK